MSKLVSNIPPQDDDAKMKLGTKYFHLTIDLCIFFCQDDFNVIIVAWGKGATAPNYNQAVSNTRMVGTQLRLIIDMMVRAGGKVGDMHLIGHSLGAHTAGYTGRLLHGRLGRITGGIF